MRQLGSQRVGWAVRGNIRTLCHVMRAAICAADKIWRRTCGVRAERVERARGTGNIGTLAPPPQCARWPLCQNIVVGSGRSWGAFQGVSEQLREFLTSPEELDDATICALLGRTETTIPQHAVYEAWCTAVAGYLEAAQPARHRTHATCCDSIEGAGRAVR